MYEWVGWELQAVREIDREKCAAYILKRRRAENLDYLKPATCRYLIVSIRDFLCLCVNAYGLVVYNAEFV